MYTAGQKIPHIPEHPTAYTHSLLLVDPSQVEKGDGSELQTDYRISGLGELHRFGPVRLCRLIFDKCF